MTSQNNVPLIVGGHTFIEPLGNEPQPSPEIQIKIVEACLDCGITWFDTTHQPERTALGRALEALGRRDEATIIAWNFMKDLEPGDDLDRPVEFQPHHLDRILEQLRSDRVEYLVLHELDGGTPDEHNRQEELAVTWRKKGYVDHLGVWDPKEDAPEKYGADNPYSFMVRPFNVKTKEAAPAFAACKGLGWQTFACSPFIRGWELDRLVENALKSEDEGESEIRAQLADLLLRFSLFQPNVDRLITAMRRVEWVERNAASAAKGPLSDDEREYLERLVNKE
jgi:aryl-alcohol dehydrogenase-like predicted oxidoreductase